jgi:predicted acyltransferase
MSNSPHRPVELPVSPSPTQRLVSLDALRGFDMFWIVGGEELIHALTHISDSEAVQVAEQQMQHKAWEGFAFYDLIFPLFVFMVGVSLVFSLGRTLAQEGTGKAVGRLVRRALLLYVLGIIYSGGIAKPGVASEFDQVRLMGVLQRIALCYLFAGLAFCFLKTWGQVLLCAGLLIGYWALMTCVSVPGVGAGNFAEGTNLANYLDQQFLPWRKYDGDHDPEGLLSTLPAIATCLLGVFAGTLLKRPGLSHWLKVLGLAGGGAALLALGWLWNDQFPVIKKIWTSSYVLVAGGYSCLLLATFYLVVDVWKFQRWAQPFVWIGMNSITIYMAHNLFDFEKIAQRLVGGDLQDHLGNFGPMVEAIVVVAMTLGLCYFLYRRKIFLRL